MQISAMYHRSRSTQVGYKWQWSQRLFAARCITRPGLCRRVVSVTCVCCVETAKDTTMVQRLQWNANRKPYGVLKLSNGTIPMILSDLEWLSKIFNGTKHRATAELFTELYDATMSETVDNAIKITIVLLFFVSYMKLVRNLLAIAKFLVSVFVFNKFERSTTLHFKVTSHLVWRGRGHADGQTDVR